MCWPGRERRKLHHCVSYAPLHGHGPCPAAQQEGDWAFRSAVYSFGGLAADGEAFIPFLPHLTGFTSCQLVRCTLEESGSLLSCFPDLEMLSLSSQVLFDDVALQMVASCENLTHLELSYNHDITAQGLLVLCARLPRLKCVTYFGCTMLNQPALDSLAGLLEACGSTVKFIHDP